MRSLPMQPGKIDDYTTASNICLRISNKEYCSTSRVRTGPGKPGKSWNLIIWIPGLESHGILAQVLESHGISCCEIVMQQSCLLFWIV